MKILTLSNGWSNLLIDIDHLGWWGWKQMWKKCKPDSSVGDNQHPHSAFRKLKGKVDYLK